MRITDTSYNLAEAHERAAGPRVSFGWIANTVAYLASSRICNTSNPNSQTYWPDISVETPENVSELIRRIRLLLACDDSALHGDERVRLIKQFCHERGWS
jgi:hypothetical protein